MKIEDRWTPPSHYAFISMHFIVTNWPANKLTFSNHEKGAPRQEISKWPMVCSTFSRSGWSVVRSALLAKRGTSKKRPSLHLHKVPTWSNKVSPWTFQMALIHLFPHPYDMFIECYLYTLIIFSYMCSNSTISHNVKHFYSFLYTILMWNNLGISAQLCFNWLSIKHTHHWCGTCNIIKIYYTKINDSLVFKIIQKDTVSKHSKSFPPAKTNVYNAVHKSHT
jgi:hypothetical protein